MGSMFVQLLARRQEFAAQACAIRSAIAFAGLLLINQP